jgi:raffinose/stachyose/melibiose transport system substrate-binding protein
MNIKRALEFLREKLPFIVIGGVFLWSCVTIASRHSEEILTDRKTIRIAHWQLEPGVRDGLNEAAAAYEKLHPDVKVIQEAIPESTYGQWLSTQFMGGTAADIVQFGKVPANQETAFYTRYVLPLSSYIGRPNPYNKGTELEGQPLNTTFKDGMRRSYITELQEFMNIPLGMASTRLFYNKTLLKELTGRDTVPSDFRGFIQVCEEIRAKPQPNGQPYIAIAGSAYHFNGRCRTTPSTPSTSTATGTSVRRNSSSASTRVRWISTTPLTRRPSRSCGRSPSSSRTAGRA